MIFWLEVFERKGVKSVFDKIDLSHFVSIGCGEIAGRVSKRSKSGTESDNLTENSVAILGLFSPKNVYYLAIMGQ